MCLLQEVVRLSKSFNPRVRFDFGNVFRTGGVGQFVNFLADSLSLTLRRQTVPTLLEIPNRVAVRQNVNNVYITNVYYKLIKTLLLQHCTFIIAPGQLSHVKICH